MIMKTTLLLGQSLPKKPARMTVIPRRACVVLPVLGAALCGFLFTLPTASALWFTNTNTPINSITLSNSFAPNGGNGAGFAAWGAVNGTTNGMAFTNAGVNVSVTTNLYVNSLRYSNATAGGYMNLGENGDPYIYLVGTNRAASATTVTNNGAPNITVNASNTLIINTAMLGTNGLVKYGSGALRISTLGGNQNLYTGGTYIYGGVITMNNPVDGSGNPLGAGSTLGNTNSDIVIANGSLAIEDVNITNGNVTLGNGTISGNLGGSLTLTGTNFTIDTTTNSGPQSSVSASIASTGNITFLKTNAGVLSLGWTNSNLSIASSNSYTGTNILWGATNTGANSTNAVLRGINPLGDPGNTLFVPRGNVFVDNGVVVAQGSITLGNASFRNAQR